MNYFLDFEATNSGQIISIGCISEDQGEQFYTKVKPSNQETITPFLTKLTGLTNKKLKNAPTADEAFLRFYKWICGTRSNTNKTECRKYYVYGDCDKDFLNTTIQHMSDTEAIACATTIAENLIDYSIQVKEYYGKNYRLIELYNCYTKLKTAQTHNALTDAFMLKIIFNNLPNIKNPEDYKNNLDKKALETETIKFNLQPVGYNLKKAPDIWFEWSENIKDKWSANGYGDKDNYFIKVIKFKTKQVIYFKDLKTALLWVMKYYDLGQTLSPKKAKNYVKIYYDLLDSMKKKKLYEGGYWKLRSDK